MAQHLVHVHSLVWIFLQQVLDELLCPLLYGYAGGEDQFWQFSLHLLVSRYIDDVLLEGWLSKKELVGEDTQTPSVYLLTVPFVAELLWGRVLKAANDCSPQAWVLIIDWTAEIADLDYILNKRFAT